MFIRLQGDCEERCGCVPILVKIEDIRKISHNLAERDSRVKSIVTLETGEEIRCLDPVSNFHKLLQDNGLLLKEKGEDNQS